MRNTIFVYTFFNYYLEHLQTADENIPPFCFSKLYRSLYVVTILGHFSIIYENFLGTPVGTKLTLSSESRESDVFRRIAESVTRKRVVSSYYTLVLYNGFLVGTGVATVDHGGPTSDPPITPATGRSTGTL